MVQRFVQVNLVGKVTPKGAAAAAEERLLRAIFGEAKEKYVIIPQKVPHGEYGIVVDAKVFTRENGAALLPGVGFRLFVFTSLRREKFLLVIRWPVVMVTRVSFPVYFR